MVVVVFPGAGDIRLGRAIRRLREARGFSLARLAIESRLDDERLDRAEHGRAHLSSTELHAVINALHAPLDLLFRTPEDLSGLRKL